MTRQLTALFTATALIVASTDGLFAQRRTGSRGSVSAASSSGRTTTTRQGNTTTTQGQRATGTRTVEQTGDGYNVNRQVTTDSGASKSVSKEVNVEDSEVNRSSTTTNQWGQSATREREVQGQGGYATIEGSAKTSTGREASADLVADRNRYGQPAVAGSVDTKYSGNYNVAAARNPYGGWNTAVAGPYGGKVTRTLPSGYRTTTYHGRPYYSYGGAYYRPYMYRGVPYYYPVPVPYYAYYDSPPVGAVVVMVARRGVPDVQGRELQQEDDEQRGQRGLSVSAPASGRQHQDASGDARARDRLRHHVLRQCQCVLPSRHERQPGDLRDRDGARRGRVRPGATRGLRGRPAQHDVLHRQRAVLRAVSLRRRQGAVRDGGPPARTAGCGDSAGLSASGRFRDEGRCGTCCCSSPARAGC